MAHLHAGAPCPHKTQAACERARRVAIGQCVAMVSRKGTGPSPCVNWGVDRVNDRPYCGQHLNSILLEADRTGRLARREAKVQGRINLFLAWTAEHPSVHDRMLVRSSE